MLPDYIITTFEGHAWERLVFRSAREVCPQVKCLAYQHAPIFKNQHSIRRFIGNTYEPDYTLQLESSQ